ARVAHVRASRSRRASTQASGPSTSHLVGARTTSGSSSAGRGALAEAPDHQGKPYAWGATGPDSFDCSGFAQYLFGHQGTELPRVARDQYAASSKVDQDAKQPGDLIFTYDGDGIYHVGVFSGDGQMWAATKSGDVVRKQTIWTSSYYVGRFA
ncbi:MAG: hydrolase, partial [Frankiales bacterium]|nr:hydrolase [Frankiales bacterium]